MEPDLYKRHYFINQLKNKHSAFVDDQVIIADSADNLQRGVFTIQNITKPFGAQVNLCTERSPKKSDEIRNQMLYRYN